MMMLPQCHLCGCSRSHLLFKKDDYAFRRCAACALVYLWPHPANLLCTYHTDYYHERSIFTATPLNAFLHHRYLKQLESFVPDSHRRLLDIGCGTGYFLDIARGRGWQVEGVDISPEAVQYARSHYRLTVHQGDAFQLPPCGDTYDAITFWDVLEHVPNPLEQLFQAHRLLKPGGVLAVSTPNVLGFSTRLAGRGSSIFNPYEHLYYFSIQTLRALLIKAGFRMLRCTTQTIYMRNIASLLSGARGQQTQQTRTRYHALYNALQGRWALYGIRLVNVILRMGAWGDQIVAFARRS